MDAETRWARLAQALGWLALILLAIACYTLVVERDLGTALGTVAPAAITGGLWYLAAARRDALLDGRRVTWPVRIGFAIVVLVGVALIVDEAARSSARSSGDDEPHTIIVPDVEEVDIPDPNGSGTIRSLARRRDHASLVAPTMPVGSSH
jgi:drug/metabolite transporter (DMT)-like permease